MSIISKIGFSLILTAVSVCSFAQHSDTVGFNRKRLLLVAGTEVIIYGSGLSYLGFIWYKDKNRVPFEYYNDLKGYCQMDKWGHCFSAYYESFASYHALRWSGMSKKKALIIGGSAGFLFQAPIEIFDGLYEGWGFSWYDVGANTIGSFLFSIQEAVYNEQIILMKFSYSPSGYPKYYSGLGKTPFESFFMDYNGHTYWLSANLKKMMGWKILPDWLNFAFGYSGNGMIQEFSNPTYYHGEPFPYFDRYRQYVFSIDADLSRIKTNRPWLNTLLKTINVIKIPFPAIEINRIDKIKFYPVYF